MKGQTWLFLSRAQNCWSLSKAAKDGQVSGGAEKQKAHISVELFQTKGLEHFSKLSDSAEVRGTEPTENPSCHVTI